MRFAADENFDNHILHALVRRYPEIVRIQDTSLYGNEYDDVLEWCAAEDRILLTHDVATLIAFAYRQVANGQTMPGVWEVSRTVPIPGIMDDLAVLIECGRPEDFQDLVVFLPLR